MLNTGNYAEYLSMASAILLKLVKLAEWLGQLARTECSYVTVKLRFSMDLIQDDPGHSHCCISRLNVMRGLTALG